MVIVGSYMLALLLNSKLAGIKAFRVIYYLPCVMPAIVGGTVWSYLMRYNTDAQGLFNRMLEGMGLPAREFFYAENLTAILSIVFMNLWSLGGGTIIWLAQFKNIPKELYEAAEIDGAKKFRKFFSITLPLIWTNVRTTLTFFVISSINLSFLFVKALTSGGPDGATEVFLSYMYKQAYTNSSYGYGMAIGVVVFLFSFGLSAVVNFVTKREPLEF